MATTTINTTAAEDARIVVAVGHILNLGRNATAAEVKSFLIAELRNAVLSDEREVASRSAVSGVAPIAPT